MALPFEAVENHVNIKARKKVIYLRLKYQSHLAVTPRLSAEINCMALPEKFAIGYTCIFQLNFALNAQ